MAVCSDGGKNALFLLKVFTHFGPGPKSVCWVLTGPILPSRTLSSEDECCGHSQILYSWSIYVTLRFGQRLLKNPHTLLFKTEDMSRVPFHDSQAQEPWVFLKSMNLVTSSCLWCNAELPFHTGLGTKLDVDWQNFPPAEWRARLVYSDVPQHMSLT